MAIQQRTQYVVDGTDNVFFASTQAGVATSTGLSTTQTGFTLTNPAGSGVNLEILQIRVAFTTAPAAIATLVLTANVTPTAAAVTQTTPLVVRSAKLGNPAGANGLAATAVTLPAAPVVVRGLGGPVATGSVSQMQIVDDVDGALVLIPNTAASINSLTTAISGIFTVVWREVPAFS